MNLSAEFFIGASTAVYLLASCLVGEAAIRKGYAVAAVFSMLAFVAIHTWKLSTLKREGRPR